MSLPFNPVSLIILAWHSCICSDTGGEADLSAQFKCHPLLFILHLCPFTVSCGICDSRGTKKEIWHLCVVFCSLQRTPGKEQRTALDFRKVHFLSGFHQAKNRLKPQLASLKKQKQRNAIKTAVKCWLRLQFASDGMDDTCEPMFLWIQAFSPQAVNNTFSATEELMSRCTVWQIIYTLNRLNSTSINLFKM